MYIGRRDASVEGKRSSSQAVGDQRRHLRDTVCLQFARVSAFKHLEQKREFLLLRVFELLALVLLVIKND